MNDSATDDSSRLAQARRWLAPLVTLSMLGWITALLSGSVLLFLIMSPQTRADWVLIHWTLGLAGLVPYVVYQIRHYLRVREYVKQTHYRVGLHAFFLVCGAIVTGVLLITPLQPGTSAYSVVDLVHIFFGFAFTLLLSAHLTLVAILTLSRTGEDEAPAARRAIALMFTLSSVASVALLVAAAFVV